MLAKWLSKINLAKTKEIVFHRPNPRNFVHPVAMDPIEQLTVVKILVFVHGGFKCDNDIHVLVCSQQVYLLKLLGDWGLQLPQLHTICQSLIVSRILYALPAGVNCYQLNRKENQCILVALVQIWVYALRHLTLNLC